MSRVVLDACAVVEYLRWSRIGREVANILETDDIGLHIPQLCLVEVVQAFRALTLRGLIPAQRARLAIADLADLPATRHPADPLLPRIWQLRGQLTAYDANYVALAEALDAQLITADLRLARSGGHDARILVVGVEKGNALPPRPPPCQRATDPAKMLTSP